MNSNIARMPALTDDEKLTAFAVGVEVMRQMRKGKPFAFNYLSGKIKFHIAGLPLKE